MDQPSTTSAGVLPPTAERRRPELVGILAVLHVLGGGAVLVMMVRWGAKAGEIGPALGTSPLMVQLSFVFLGGLGLASGVGMWRGAKWGWWLAAFYYVYAIYRNAGAMTLIVSMADQLAGESRGPGYYYVKHSIRIVTSALVLAYLFRDHVLDYFGLRQLPKKAALVQLARPVAALIVIQLLSMIW